MSAISKRTMCIVPSDDEYTFKSEQTVLKKLKDFGQTVKKLQDSMEKYLSNLSE